MIVRRPSVPVARVVVAALLVLSALTACTPPGLPDPLPPVASSSGAVGPQRPAGTLVVGSDTVPTGFNPHAVADFSITSRTVTELVLPSASRVDATGTVRIDPNLIRSAVVTSDDPFTVTYRVRNEAAWSDGTPITAEDFSYLAEQMVTEPGTVAPAGYRAIEQVLSRDAGKTVVVEFARPVADWTELFSPLLPSHLMRDSPGGWTQALGPGLPVSGGQYKMAAYDTATGVLRLVRNDKYWGEQPGPAAVELRIGDARALQASLSRGDLDLLLRGRVPVAETPADRALRIPMAASTQLVVAAGVGPTAAVLVRRALGRAVDLPALVGAAGTSGTPVTGILPDDVGADGPLPTALTLDLDTADTLLSRAGWVRSPGVYRQRTGEVLRLTLGVPADRPDLARVAVALQHELVAIGIELSIVRDTTGQVVAGVAAGSLSLALVERPAVVSPSLSSASWFGCGESPSVEATEDGDATASTTGVQNLSGFCSTVVETVLDRWVAGEPGDYPLGERLLREVPVIPVQGVVWQLEWAPGFTGALPSTAVPGWGWTGPLADVGSGPAGH